MARSQYQDEELSCFAGFKHMLFGTSPRAQKRIVPSTSTSESEKPSIQSSISEPPTRSAPPRQIRRRSTRPASMIQAATIVEAEPSSPDPQYAPQYATQDPPVQHEQRPKREPGRKYSTTLDKWVMRSNPATQGNPNAPAHAPNLAYKTQPTPQQPQPQTQTQGGHQMTTPFKSHFQSSPTREQYAAQYQDSTLDAGRPKGRRTSTFPVGIAQIDTAGSQGQGVAVDALKIDSPMDGMGGAGGSGGMVVGTTIAVSAGDGGWPVVQKGGRRTSDWFG